MDELLLWLKSQNGGMGTYTEFQRRALAMLSTEPEHAALARLLVDMAGRLVSAYDGEPLSFDVADRAFGKLIALVEQAVSAEAGSSAEKIASLNEVGRAELA